MTDLVAPERKFVAYSRLKKAEKFNFSLNLVPIKSVLLLPFFLKDPVVYWSALLTGVHLVAHIRSAAAQLECLAPPVKGGTQGLGND